MNARKATRGIECPIFEHFLYNRQDIPVLYIVCVQNFDYFGKTLNEEFLTEKVPMT
jgi:hypothetical protein